MSAVPSAYTPSYDFSDFSDASPTSQHSGTQMDAQFDAISTLTTAMLARAAEIQRDDGGIKNGVVGLDALSEQAKRNLAQPAAWVADTAYEIGTTIVQSGSLYLCVVDHASGTFATDLAAVKWTLLGAMASADTMPQHAVIQSQTGYFTAETAVTGTIPYDTTAPLVTEGDAINYGISTSQTFALNNSANTVRLTLNLRVAGSLATGVQLKPIASIFRSINSGTYTLVGAIEGVLENDHSGTKTKTTFLSGAIEDAPASALTLAYRVRVGTPTGATLVAGLDATATLGGYNKTNFLQIEEIKA